MRRLIREIHRRSLWQVLGVYLVGSYVGYEVILALTDGVGLPSWVPPFAIVLFIIGLPIVLATAIVQEGHPFRAGEDAGGQAGDRPGPRGLAGLETAADAVAAAHHEELAERRAGGSGGSSGTGVGADARSPGTDTAGGAPRRREVLTWNRAITAGVLSFAALGLATTGFLGMRSLGIGPAATLVSSGVLDERSVVVLSDFAGGDGAAGAADLVTEALRIDLHESTVMNLADGGYLADVLRRMERDPSAAFTAEVAREVAEREGLPAVITGEVRALGGRYLLSAQVESADGSVLAAFREEAADEASLLEAVDALSTRIREKVGESLRSVRRSEPLAAVSTSSLEALRLYSQAQRLAARTADDLQAAELYRRAVEVDSTFAMAWRKLGISLSNTGASETDFVEAFRRAFELRDRLPDQERYLAEAGYHHYAVNDDDAAAQAYRTLLELNPDHTAALNNLAIIEGAQGRPEEAAALLRAATSAEPTPLHYGNLAHMELRLGNLAAAEAAVTAGLELSPTHENLLLIQAGVANSKGEHEKAVAAADRMAAAHAGGQGAMVADLIRASVAGSAGRFATVSRLFDAADDRARRLGIEPWLAITARLEAELPLVLLGDTAETVRRVEAALADPELRALGPRQRDLLSAARILARAGEPERAEAVLDEARASFQAAGLRFNEDDAAGARAVIARARGQLGEALELLDRAEATGAFAADIELERAAVHEAADRPDSAIAAYERALDVHGFPRFSFDPVNRAYIVQRLAELYDDRGDTERAVEYYARFLEMWADADPELQPRVEAVRRRLAALAGVG